MNWEEVKIHFGKKVGTLLGDLSARDLRWWKDNWKPNPDFCKSKLGRLPDPGNCADCRLRAALDAAVIEPVIDNGVTVGRAEKVTVAVEVKSLREFETEFNWKKVVQTHIYFARSDGALFFWKTSTAPDLEEGELITITGTIKNHFTNQSGEKVTALKNVKVEGARKLEPQKTIVLFSDGKSSQDRYAVCTEDGEVMECGSANLGRPNNGDNTDHELFAAMAAFRIAARIKEAEALDCIGLELRFDAQWMTGMVGKAKPLRDFARANKLVVTMTRISGVDNPADQWTVTGGEVKL